MKILITGAAGSTGSIAAQLLAVMPDVEMIVGVDNMFNGDMDNLWSLKDDPKFYLEVADILDKTRMFEIFQNGQFTHVIHAAAWVHTDHFYNSVYDVYKNNVEGTEIILALAEQFKVKRFLNCSTSEAFGHMESFPGSPFARSSFDSPMTSKRWSYAVGKLMCEHLAIDYDGKSPMTVVSMRYGNIYGKRDLKSTHLVPWVIRSAIQNKSVVLTAGSQSRMRSFINADDAASATVQALLYGIGGMVYACGGKEEDTVANIARRILGLMGMEGVPVLIGTEHRAGDPDRRLLDTTLLEKDTGWMQTVSLDAGLLQVIELIRDELDPS